MIVTAVERLPRRRRVNVYVDGHFAIALDRNLAAERGLRPGREVDGAELQELADAGDRYEARRAALRLLSYRPRSEQELRQRLSRRGLPEPAIAETLGRLRELGYVDDAAFARFWTDTQQAARPRARRVLAGELRRRGVGRGEADEATAGISDEEAAYTAAARRLPALAELEYGPFRERLGRFLTGRGFGYGVARETIDRCWRELHDSSPEGDGSNELSA